MKKIALIYGIIGGLIPGGLLIISSWNSPDMFNPDSNSLGASEIVGASIMFIASILSIHLGIRHVKLKELGGKIKYWKAFKTGALIMVATYVIYTLISGFGFYGRYPDWIHKYTDKQIEMIKNNPNLTDEVKTTKIESVKNWAGMPGILLAAIEATYLLFFGILVSFVSAAILRTKDTEGETQVA